MHAYMYVPACAQQAIIMLYAKTMYVYIARSIEANYNIFSPCSLQHMHIYHCMVIGGYIYIYIYVYNIDYVLNYIIIHLHTQYQHIIWRAHIAYNTNSEN